MSKILEAISTYIDNNTSYQKFNGLTSLYRVQVTSCTARVDMKYSELSNTYNLITSKTHLYQSQHPI